MVIGKMIENQDSPTTRINNIKRHIRVVIAALLFMGIGFTLCWFIRPPGPGFAPYLLIADVPNMPEASDTFDCKNSALFMYEYFTEKGYECLIITGNLELKNEDIFDCPHMWVLVKKPGEDAALAFDWGYPCVDTQHYEGYPISYEELKDAVEAGAPPIKLLPEHTE